MKIGSIFLAILALGTVLFVLGSYLYQRQSARDQAALNRIKEAEVRAPAMADPGGVVKRVEPDDHRQIRIDLDGAQAYAKIPYDWRRIEEGTYLRARDRFLVDTFNIYADCLGECQRVRSNLRKLGEVWKEKHEIFALKWEFKAEDLQQIDEGTAALFALLLFPIVDG